MKPEVKAEAKSHAVELALKLSRLAADERELAEQARLAELASFHSEEGGQEAHAAAEMISRGKALAYEDAAVMVRLLVAWIPEDA